MRRAVVVSVVALALVGAWTASAVRAGAHAALKRSEPANGQLLDRSPAEIRLSFTEPPDLSLTTIGVVDRTGTAVRTGPVEVAGGDDQTIRVALQDLPDGVYTVSWRTVSATDGHLTSGSFSFGVGVSAADVTPVRQEDRARATSPTAAGVAGRWALYAGLAVLFGAAAGGLFAFGPLSVHRPRLLGGAWTLAAAGVVVTTLDERATVGVSLGTLLRSDAGASLARLAVAVALVGLVALAASLRPGTATLVLLAGTTAAAMAVRAFAGHAGPSVLEGTLQAAHFAAVGAWIGGLVWLVLAVRRGAEPERVRRYSTIAATGLAVIVVTGYLRATNELGGFGWWLRAFDNSYGVALVVKLAIVAALVSLGAVNRYRNVRRYEALGARPLLRTVSGELVLAAGALAMTGLLTGLAPQGVVASAGPRPPAPLVVTGSDFATTTKVRLQISPGTVGPNAFEARVTDYDTGEPVDARKVTLQFSLPERPEVDSTLELERGTNGTWRAGGTSLSLDGTWDVRVLVEGSAGSVEVPLRVTPKSPRQDIDVSRAEGQPDIYTIHLEDGVTVQAYVDPGTPGQTNQVHLTAFDAGGAELPLHHAVLDITPEDGQLLEPELIRLSSGHFVANVEIASGTSTFAISMLTRDGRDLAASFQETFAG